MWAVDENEQLASFSDCIIPVGRAPVLNGLEDGRALETAGKKKFRLAGNRTAIIQLVCESVSWLSCVIS
jgi:hypothetical protein